MKISVRILAALAAGERTFDELLAAIDVPKDDLNKVLQILRTKGEISFAGGRWSRGTPAAPPAPAIAVSAPTPPSPPPVAPAPAAPQSKGKPMAKTKQCSKCEDDKPLDQFAKNASTKDGLAYWCKSCTKQANAARYRTQHGGSAKSKPTSPAPKKARKTNGSGGILEGLRTHREKLQRSIDIVDQAISLLEADA